MTSVLKARKKGFTLVELVVVIAIIAILSTVGIVSYTSVINKARDSAAAQELDQLHSAMVAESYTTEIKRDFEFDGKVFTFAANETDVEDEIQTWVAAVVTVNDGFLKLTSEGLVDGLDVSVSVDSGLEKVTFTYTKADGGVATRTYSVVNTEA